MTLKIKCLHYPSRIFADAMDTKLLIAISIAGIFFMECNGQCPTIEHQRWIQRCLKEHLGWSIAHCQDELRETCSSFKSRGLMNWSVKGAYEYRQMCTCVIKIDATFP